jgi:hypothetical protein
VGAHFIGFFVTTFMLPAWAMIGYWIVLQFIQGFLSLSVQTMETGGVALGIVGEACKV